MKRCPYCDEEIQGNAKKCKHCGEWLKDEEKMEIKNIDREDEVLCPITGEVADTIITIYKWSYYLIYFEVQKVKI